ncbi:hypothetical protein GCM10017784_30470 [Deinococcus indicus]|uniref:hypothetical protein n=1 Tax=Deinococcus indicus TaxID=223556 RepID=UPI00174CFE15|nr:hypothetical protein [Deinococcus indicus]GHG34538.1 hypothetical protein GCM10017784_30470 [Deinococcus indicus]
MNEPTAALCLAAYVMTMSLFALSLLNSLAKLRPTPRPMNECPNCTELTSNDGLCDLCAAVAEGVAA